MHLSHAAGQCHRHPSIDPASCILVKLASLQRDLNLPVFDLCHFQHSTLFVFQLSQMPLHHPPIDSGMRLHLPDSQLQPVSSGVARHHCQWLKSLIRH